MSRRLFALLILVSISVTACNRQASDPVDVVAEAQSGVGQVPTMTTIPAEETVETTPEIVPTATDGIAVITSTSVAATSTPTATATETLVAATETPTVLPTETVPLNSPTPTATSTPVSSPTFTAQPLNTDIPTNTPLAAAGVATETITAIAPPTEMATETPTELPSETPEPTTPASSATPVVIVVTATTNPNIVTPGVPQGNESNISTPTPLVTATAEATLEPTPTDMFATPTGSDSTSTDENTDSTQSECIYVVQRGDNLFRIALNNGVTLNAMIAANPDIVTPTLILPGDELVIPGCEPDPVVEQPTTDDGVEDRGIIGNGETLHSVVAGETLLAIARRYGVTINAIVERNGLADPNRLSVGQELIIPPPGN